MAVLATLLLAFGATAALAAAINGTAGNDRIAGTDQADHSVASA